MLTSPRAAFLVSPADTAVVVGDVRELDLRRVLQLVRRREIPLHVIGALALQVKVRKVKNPGLPD
jgi:hypothetical protein